MVIITKTKAQKLAEEAKRIESLYVWHKYFAWKPVRWDGGWAWLSWVYRKRNPIRDHEGPAETCLRSVDGYHITCKAWVEDRGRYPVMYSMVLRAHAAKGFEDEYKPISTLAVNGG